MTAMDGRRTIYVISQGAYSDYGVVVAFECEDDAKRAVELGIGDDYLKMGLFAAGRMPEKTVVWHAQAFLKRTHNFDEPRAWAAECWDNEAIEVPSRVNIDVQETSGGWLIFATGPDQEGVLKATADALAKRRYEQFG